MSKKNRSEYMNMYEDLMKKSEQCILKALRYYRKKDTYMVIFYLRASEYYRTKALSLPLICQ